MADLEEFQKDQRQEQRFSSQNEEDVIAADQKTREWDGAYQEAQNEMIYPSRPLSYYSNMPIKTRTLRVGDITRKMRVTHEYVANACEPNDERKLIQLIIPIGYFHNMAECMSIDDEMFRLQCATLHDVRVCVPPNLRFDHATFGEVLILYPDQTITDEQCEQKTVAFSDIDWEDPDSTAHVNSSARHRCIGRLYGEIEHRVRRPPSHGKSYRNGKLHKKIFVKKLDVPHVDPKLPAEIYRSLQRRLEAEQKKNKTPFAKWNPITKYRVVYIQKHIFERRHTLAAKQRIREDERAEYHHHHQNEEEEGPVSKRRRIQEEGEDDF